jgi:RNA polymerase sigma factor (sigma-70 family)
MKVHSSNVTDEGGCTYWVPLCQDDCLRNKLVAYAYQLLPVGEKHAAEDIVQEAFLRCFTYTVGREIEDPSNYVFATVKNLCFNRHKSPSHLTPANCVRLDDPQHGKEMEAIREIPDLGPNPEAKMEIKERNETLRRLLAAKSSDLSKHERALLILHLEGYSTKEIARMLSANVAAIRVDMNRIVATIRHRVRHPHGKTNRKRKAKSTSQS